MPDIVWDSGSTGLEIADSGKSVECRYSYSGANSALVTASLPTSGKVYWEVEVVSFNSTRESPDCMLIGYSDEDYVSLGNSTRGLMHTGGDCSMANDRDTSLDLVTIGIAVDIDEGKVWFAKDDVWWGDPEAGTSPDGTSLTFPNGVFPTCYLTTIGDKLMGAFSTEEITYTPPTGFTPLGDDPVVDSEIVGTIAFSGVVSAEGPALGTAEIEGGIVFSGRVDGVSYHLNGISGVLAISGQISAYQIGTGEVIGGIAISGSLDAISTIAGAISGAIAIQGSAEAISHSGEIVGRIAFMGSGSAETPGAVDIIGSISFAGNVDARLTTMPSCALPSFGSSRWV